MKKIAIIGAGLSGVTLGRALSDHAQVTLFEKSRSVGGRMATRRRPPFHFDHGAQYFTVKHPDFERALVQPLSQGIVQKWAGPHLQIKISDQAAEQITAKSDSDHYVASPAMNSLAKYFAESLQIKTQTRVGKIHRTAEGLWSVSDEAEQTLGEYDWVISTAPQVQTAALMPSQYAYSDKISQCVMSPCFALMLGFRTLLSLSFSSARYVGSDIAWIANNASKPGRPDEPSLVIHASPEWSEAHLEHPEAEVVSTLTRLASELIGQDCSEAIEVSLQRWRYALAKTQSEQQVFVDQDECLAVAGDWCWGGRVEWAYLNGLRTAEAIQAVLV
jgi:predicted NAD/FAD-dependent oxidoreductase